MDIRELLSSRIHIHDIQEICLSAEGNPEQIASLYDLIFIPDDFISYQVLWVISHLSDTSNKWFYDKQDRLIDEALVCQHPGKRRLLLHLLLRQPQANPPRVDFLDFCLEKMLSCKEPAGSRCLCMKLGYALCRPIPELLREFCLALDIAEPESLSGALRATRRNILKAILSN